MSYRVAPYSGDLWCVRDGYSEVVGGPYDTRGKASSEMGRLEAIEAERATKKERKCMTCGVKFMSEGIHERLCKTHRRMSQPVAL